MQAVRHDDRSLRLLVALLERRDRIVSRGDLYALPERRFIHTHVRFGYRLDPQGETTT
jgi:hypothetical protein